MNFNPKLLSVSAFALCVALNSAQAQITLQSTGETLTGDMTISQDMLIFLCTVPLWESNRSFYPI